MKKPEPTPDLFSADEIPFNLVGEVIPKKLDMKIEETNQDKETAPLF